MTAVDGSSGPGPELGGQVRTALRWSSLNSVLLRVGNVAVTIALARLIAPEQFGVYAAALVVITILLSISELGVSVALVRHDGSVRTLAPTVTTLALLSAGALGGLSLLAAPLVATALGAPEATGVIRLLSVSVVLAGLTAVPGAILQREFRQGRKLLADGLGFGVTTAVGVSLAVAGWGAWALAWGRIAGVVAVAVALLALTPERYRPGWDPEVARSVLAFGLPLAGSSLLIFSVLNVDYVVVGSTLSTAQLGFYLIAVNLASWPVNAFSAPVRAVSTAGFSRLREDPARFAASFAPALRTLVTVAVPFCVLLSALATPLVRLLYGERWVPSATPLAVLAFLGAARVAVELAYDFLAAAGRSRAILLVHVLWLLALAPALVLGASTAGLAGVAWAHVAVVAGVVVPAYGWTLHRLGVSPRTVGRALLRPVAGAVTMFVVATLVVRVAPGGDLARLVLGGGAAGLAYLAVISPMRKELLTLMLPRPTTPAPSP